MAVLFRSAIEPLACLAFSLGALFGSPSLLARAQLVPVVLQTAEREALGWDERLFSDPGARENLLQSIDYSLTYLQTPRAEAAYADYPIASFSRDRVYRSLVRFRELVVSANSTAELQDAVAQEFTFYRSVGRDGAGTVAFTGYFEPIYQGSRTPTPEYRYPLYRKPPDLESWPYPRPTRLELEGKDGLQGPKGPLKDLELVWLRDRFEAFLVQVQGSARIQLPNGSLVSVNYAGQTGQPYVSVGGELIRDGYLHPDDLTLQNVIQFFRDRPQALNEYLPRNPSFVFFRETGGAPPLGSLGYPVTRERSIATDKSVMPPGALALVRFPLPVPVGEDALEKRPNDLFVLDQDTGGAITGAGRVDLFLGTGALAGDRAGLVNDYGSLYYLLLKE